MSVHLDPKFLIFLDSETTGLDPKKTNIVEIALKILNQTTGEEVERYQAVVKLSEEQWEQASPYALKVNGFTWERVCEEGKEVKTIRNDINDLFESLSISNYNARFYCQNPTFDRSFYSEHLFTVEEQKSNKQPLRWLDLCSAHQALSIKRAQEKPVPFFPSISYSKDGIAKQLGLPPEEKPHGAMNGVDHLISCYRRDVGFEQWEGEDKLTLEPLKESEQHHLIFMSSEWEGKKVTKIEIAIVDMASGKLKAEIGSQIKEDASLEELAKDVAEIFEKNAIHKCTSHFYCHDSVEGCKNRAIFDRLFSDEQQRERKYPYHWNDLASANHALSTREAHKEKSPLPGFPNSSEERGIEKLIEGYRETVGYLSEER